MVSDGPGGAILDIRVIPRAGRSRVAGTREGALLVRLAAAPVDGAANIELVALLARVLQVPPRRVLLISGEKSRSKRVRVTGLSAAFVLERLAGATDGR